MKGKLGQSSVNGLLNDFSSVNPLPLPDIMEIDSLRGNCEEKRCRKTTDLVMVMQYFHAVLEHELSPSPDLNHNAYSIFPFTCGVKAWHATQNYISTLPELSEWALQPTYCCVIVKWELCFQTFTWKKYVNILNPI